MAAGWMSVLKLVPWSDVISNAPKVADGAKKLWDTVAKKTGTANPSGDPVGAPDQFDTPTLAQLQASVASQEAKISELQQQMLSASALMQNLADQNTQLVQRLQANRVWLRGLSVASILLCAAMVLSLALNLRG